MTPSNSLPEKQRLWEGCVFGGIASALVCIESETVGSQRFWEQQAYVCEALDGRRGMVSFEAGHLTHNGYLVGLFFDPKSPRSPFNCSGYDVEIFIGSMPLIHRRVAEDIFGTFLFDELHDATVPLVTAAVWNADETRLVTNGSWEAAISDGVGLISKECQGCTDNAIAEWRTEYDMSSVLMDISMDLFRKRINQPGEKIILEDQVSRQLRAIAGDTQFRLCRHHLSSLDIYAAPIN